MIEQYFRFEKCSFGVWATHKMIGYKPRVFQNRGQRRNCHSPKNGGLSAPIVSEEEIYIRNFRYRFGRSSWKLKFQDRLLEASKFVNIEFFDVQRIAQYSF